MQAVLLLILLAFKLTTYGSFSYSHGLSLVQASWENTAADEKLLHMTIDEQTGQKRVYIGAVNKIYQLSSDLKLEAQAQMGPVQDSYECPVTGQCPNIELKPMNYYNKALVIHSPSYTPTTNASYSMPRHASTLPLTAASATSPSDSHHFSPLISSSLDNNYFNVSNQQYSNTRSNPWLISCGTTYQGVCAVHNLDNITQYHIPANESVVPNSLYASTVAFIAPGPTNPLTKRQPPVLYVGASYSGLGPYSAEVPAVSSRSLQLDSIFNIASTNVASGTRLTVNSLSRDKFPINYVHGFASRGFSYFVTVQRKTSNQPQPFITKIARVCHNDANYHSYVETQLACHSAEVDYNLAQAAYVGKPGADLATNFGITTNDDVLYVVFAKSTDKRDIYNEPGQQSALCVYSLRYIQSTFTQNIQYCFNGNGDQGLDFISQTQQCSQTQVQISDDFCGMDANHLINGHFPVETTPVIVYNNVSITAVAASPTNDFTVAYLGTSTGQLKHVVVEDSISGTEYANPIVDPQRRTPINPDMRFERRDETADFLYVMNDKKIYLIKLQECNQYKTCSDCLKASDPYCGWCSLKNRCSVKSACTEATQDSLHWLSYRKGKCTSMINVSPSHIQETMTKTLESSVANTRIMSVIPSKGPKAGGTKLVIWGLDMNVGNRVEASVGEAFCEIISRHADRVECLTSPVDAPGSRRVAIKFDGEERAFQDYSFLYIDDPEIDAVTSQAVTNHHTRAGFIYPPPKGIFAGGITIYVKGKNFVAIQEPRFYVIADGVKYSAPCHVDNHGTNMSCFTPPVPEERVSASRSTGLDEPVELDYGFFMDNVEGVHNLATRRENRLPFFLMYSNPEFYPFPEEIKYYKSDYLTINGSNLDRASSEYDIDVRIGNDSCNVTSLSRTQLTCKPPATQPMARGQLDNSLLPEVVVTVGHSLNFTIGKISYDSSEGLERIFSKSIVFLMVISVCFLMLVVVVILIAYRRKASESNKVVKTMQERMDVLEMKVASEAKQAFTELQTEMTDLTDDLEHGGIPYLDYRIYTMKVLFPNQTDHPVLSEMQVDPRIRPALEEGLASFGELILNKTFLLLFIRTLESNRYFSMRDRVNVASLIMVTLQNRMEYCTDILKTLLSNLIDKSMESRSHPKLLLRRTESVAERMLSSWFTFLLYKFLRECAGEPLFLLYQAIKHQVNKGPVDAITSEARCTLSEEKLIRQSVEYKPMTVHVSMLPQTAYLSGVDPNLQTGAIETPVKVLDCDAISQVKEKAIDTIYKSAPYSQRPPVDNLNIEWRASSTARILMADRDHTNKTEGYCKRINTLSHYKVPDNASLTLVTKQISLYDMTMAMNDKHRYETLSHFGFGKTISSAINRPTSPLIKLDDGFKYWHLVKHHDNDHRDGERSGKMVSEIYLTRLLATKGTLQRFVDDLFETIFSTARLTSSLPIAIKYMFDFLDDQAHGHGIRDPEVVHTWKSNCLPLRFWVNLIKNPNFVFDINKSHIVDSCLSVVAQTFMDACSKSEHRLGKDSPSSKLLYAKDLPIYKDWVERYYNEIAMMPPINEHDMNAMLAEESRQHAHEFNVNVSLNELFMYAVKYQEQLIIALDEDEFAKKSKLAARFRQTMLKMNHDNNLYLRHRFAGDEKSMSERQN